MIIAILSTAAGVVRILASAIERLHHSPFGGFGCEEVTVYSMQAEKQNDVDHGWSGRSPRSQYLEERTSMGQILWIILVIIVAIWLIGLVANVAGNLIHLLLVVALIVLVYNLITGRRQI
jgi:hypothetical protein